MLAGAGGNGSLVISGVVNPGAGTYGANDFSVATTGQAATNPAAAIAISGLTAVTFSGTSMVAGANTTWTVGFTNALALSPGDAITVTFAPGFTLLRPRRLAHRGRLQRYLHGPDR